MTRALFSLSFALALLAAAPARAGEGEDTGTFNLLVENDLFGSGSDRHYTHGTRLSWLSPEGDVPDWVAEGAAWVPLFPTEGRLRVSYALGQNMYTPENIAEDDLIVTDRPYGGWTYFGLGLTSDTGGRLDNVELDLGMIGPASLADRTQKLVHEAIGSTIPRGWHNQLRNEPGIVLNYETKWRNLHEFDLFGLGVDFTPHVGASLGNVFTLAATGATVRFGQDLPSDYGPPRIRPSLPGSAFFKPSEGFGWYLFAGVEGRAVARNIFLDGNTFADSHHVDKIPFVGDVQAGVALTYGPARLAFTQVFRTREFEGQDSPDRFGAINLTIRF